MYIMLCDSESQQKTVHIGLTQLFVLYVGYVFQFFVEHNHDCKGRFKMKDKTSI